MKILVTGGTGYIGSHTVVELQQAGYEVVIIDSLVNSTLEVLGNIARITGTRPDFEQFDLAERELTLDFFRRHQDISGVIHFAALKAVGESVEKPLLYYHNNLFSLLNVMEGMGIAGINNLVFSSSCTVYGQPDVLPVREDSPAQQACSPYGNTKKIAEEIIRDSVNGANAKLRCISLRYFNPVGAHSSALIGELPMGVPNNLVPFITQTAIGKHPVVRVFGTDYNTPDGTAVRDYLHVVDLAKAHVIALRRLTGNHGKTAFEAFNLGTGTGISVLEVIQAFERVSGLRLNYELSGRRAGDIEKIWADAGFAASELGWKSERSLDDMMLSAWNWEKHLSNKA